ncbi:hypothetical protein ACT29H_08735 [Thermophagus sp. OGC60D27]|uniref:hypothetical protein n=1 Tax=Thermophagus sp. OGC60D27 TaxID=3458415 RepID=UPI0040381960
MKTLMISLGAMFLGVMIGSAQNLMTNHVVTHSDTIFCGKLDVRTFKTKCTLEDGKTITINNKDILRYSQNGRLFVKLPVYRNNQLTRRMSMMELIKCKNGVLVFKDEFFNGARESLDAHFYFYKDGKCLNIQRNPAVDNIMAYLDTFGESDNELKDGRKMARQ